jgi:hypothetical protein
MRVIRRYVRDDEIREALDRAPPGIIDPRSWAYWNLKMGRFPPPRMPKRTFGEPTLEDQDSTLAADLIRQQQGRGPHRSENRPSLRNSPVSRATRGETSIPM